MTVPLDRLPPPAAVAVEDFATLRDGAIADLVKRVPDYDPRPTDPAVRLIEVAAYLRLLLGGRVNDAVRGTFLATATGPDLDHVASAMNVARLSGESDDRLRARALLAWEAVSTAGPIGSYRFHAMSVQGVADVGVTSPTPGAVTITVQAEASGGVADAALLAAVRKALNQDTVRPVTDVVTVRSVAVVGYTVAATLTVAAGPDREVVRAAATAAVRAHVAAASGIGRRVYRSALIAACHVPGVDAVNLTMPAADVVVTSAQMALAGAITITVP